MFGGSHRGSLAAPTRPTLVSWMLGGELDGEVAGATAGCRVAWANHPLRSKLARIMGRILRWVAPWPSGRAYPGDFHGAASIRYARDGGSGDVAGPGEIVWTWVPFEEDQRQGKDRPVLVIARNGRWLLAVPLTSKHHGRDPRARAGTRGQWTDIGSGPWDRAGRASSVRVDRILRVDPAEVRRHGAVLDKGRFTQVADTVHDARSSR